MSRRTFYEQFLDREDCFLVAFAQSIERIAAVVVPAYRKPPKWPERVRCGLAVLLQFLDREPALARLVVVEAFGAGPRALERRQHCIARVVAVVDSEGRVAKAGPGPPPLTGEGVVGGVLSLIHARLTFPAPTKPENSSAAPSPADASSGSVEAASLVELLNPLVSLVISPYLGPAAARRELDRPLSVSFCEPSGTELIRSGTRDRQAGHPLRDLDMRLTYRTIRVLLAIDQLAGRGCCPSNRQVGDAAGIRDQGQVSKLLARLEQLGLVENRLEARVKGEPNAWMLTERGCEVGAVLAA